MKKFIIVTNDEVDTQEVLDTVHNSSWFANVEWFVHPDSAQKED